jgi:hypothetical protein
MARNTNKFEQATAANTGIGNEVRTDEGVLGVVVKLPKRGPITVKLADGNLQKVNLDQLEVNTAKAVSLSDIPADEKAPKAVPVRERKETITRVVGGREYTYQNLGGGHIDNGDAVAVELRGKTLPEVYDIAAKRLGATVEQLQEAYGSNNPGRQRMTLGNMLRAQEKAANAGVAYVPPFKAAEVKAANKAAREKAAAEKKEAATKAAAEKTAAREAAKAAAKKTADEKAAQKAAEREALAKANAEKRAAAAAKKTPAATVTA